jgi:hypothetical protein
VLEHWGICKLITQRKEGLPYIIGLALWFILFSRALLSWLWFLLLAAIGFPLGRRRGLGGYYIIY